MNKIRLILNSDFSLMDVGSRRGGLAPLDFKHGTNIVKRGLKVLFFGLFLLFLGLFFR